MSVSPQTQAILLLTVAFTKPAPGDPEPLTPAEWGRFAAWLKGQEKSPELLLTSDDPIAVLQGWSDPSVTPERIRHLLGRSGAMGLALEKWQRAGLWVMTRSDAEYPARLKRRLRFEAPPMLFGCGDRGLLNRAGIAVVGSRAAGEKELGDASRLGAEIASQGFSLVSGGARGVDEAAMLGALESQGTAAGVLADSLLRAAMSAKYRKGLMGKNLVLVSPFNPEAAFDAGNAMARNKYIYCLADAAVVVTTSKESGGTWNGAIENLKHGWVPLWVKEHPDPDSGNADLVRQGARWLPAGDLVVASLVS
jgi:predicted Rossmann fold nucleotide-binding protein DprA/Smf involved in DNA uptake